jgi:hypothetical protein
VHGAPGGATGKREGTKGRSGRRHRTSPPRRGAGLSLQRCIHQPARLAANATCGARCPDFPDCLPPPPAELAERLLELHQADRREGLATAAGIAALELLHDAITEGLARKE